MKKRLKPNVYMNVFEKNWQKSEPFCCLICRTQDDDWKLNPPERDTFETAVLQT